MVKVRVGNRRQASLGNYEVIVEYKHRARVTKREVNVKAFVDGFHK
jgi:hypothetical protein